MFYIVLYFTCKAGICVPEFGEPVESPDKCFEIVKALPERKDMKAMCVPVIK